MVYPLVHHACKQKLFAILRKNSFYCKKCKVYITAMDEKGNPVRRNSKTPYITEEEIYASLKNGQSFTDRKVIFKLLARPKET